MNKKNAFLLHSDNGLHATIRITKFFFYDIGELKSEENIKKETFNCSQNKKEQSSEF